VCFQLDSSPDSCPSPPLVFFTLARLKCFFSSAFCQRVIFRTFLFLFRIDRQVRSFFPLRLRPVSCWVSITYCFPCLLLVQRSGLFAPCFILVSEFCLLKYRPPGLVFFAGSLLSVIYKPRCSLDCLFKFLLPRRSSGHVATVDFES